MFSKVSFYSFSEAAEEFGQAKHKTMPNEEVRVLWVTEHTKQLKVLKKTPNYYIMAGNEQTLGNWTIGCMDLRGKITIDFIPSNQGIILNHFQSVEGAPSQIRHPQGQKVVEPKGQQQQGLYRVPKLQGVQVESWYQN